MAMGEMATPRSPLQSDSEGSTSSLELGSAVASIAITGSTTPPPSTVPEAVKCRWHLCGLWLASLDALALHVTLAHATAGRGGLFYCGWDGCSRGHRGFNARYKMLVHVRTHTNERPHRCTRCEKSFSRAENLKIHARSHTGERPYACPVPGCSKAYSNSSDRFKHTRTHAVDKPYVCKVEGCPKRYTDPSSLRKHVKTYRHFPSCSSSSVGAASDRDSLHGSERDTPSPSPSSDEEVRGSAFRPLAERPPLPGEYRGIPIKKAISARLRAVGGVRHQDGSGKSWVGGSVWLGGAGSPSSLSPSSSPAPSPGGPGAPAADWFTAAAPLYASPGTSPASPWAWATVPVNSMLSVWAFPSAATARTAPRAPSPAPSLAVAPSAQAAPLDLTVVRH